jgi:DNA-binding SARP family transcriptional activator
VFSLKLLGSASLEGPGGRLTGQAVQRHRMAMLALLAGSPSPRTLNRDKLTAWLWPESDSEHARRLLNQAVHVLRRELGAEVILSVAEDLQLNPALVSCDVVAFEEALAAGELERCAGLYRGPFLDGFFLSDAPEFDQWLGRERDRLAAAFARALDGLAERAEAVGDRGGAVGWWKARAALDPYDSSVALRLILALEASGNRAAALLEAGEHGRLLKEELDMAPPPELRELTERLRSAPTAILSRKAREPEKAANREGTEGDSAPLAAARAPELQRTSQRGLWYAAVAILTVGAVLGALLLRSKPTESRPGVGTVSASSVDEIAQAVARELTRRERGDTTRIRHEQRTRSIPAYELYLRGSDPALFRSDSAARRGLEYFRRAVALDSTYAAAWAGLARMIRRTEPDNPAGRRQSQTDAEAAASKAVALDDSLPDAHVVLAVTRASRFDLAGTESELLRAIALEPGAARGHERLVRLYGWWGRPADALREGRNALALEPLSSTANAELARALLFNGRSDEALEQLEKVAGLDPPLPRAGIIAAICYAQKAMWSEAIAAARPSSSLPRFAGFYGYLMARAGRRDSAGLVLSKLMEQGENSLNIALVYAGLGDIGEAVRWLDRAIDDYSLTPLSDLAPIVISFLDSQRRDPRIATLRTRLGLQNR